jgi:hypothetical protein
MSWCPFQQDVLGVSFKDSSMIKVIYLADMPVRESNSFLADMTLALTDVAPFTMNNIPYPYRTKQVNFQDFSAEVFTWAPTPMGSEIMKLMSIQSQDNVPVMKTLYHPPSITLDPSGRIALIKKGNPMIMEPTAPFIKDISDLMHRRAQQGYSTDPEKNMKLDLEDGLKLIWQRLASNS